MIQPILYSLFYPLLSVHLPFHLIPIFAAILYFNGRANEEQGQMVSPVNPENDRIRVEDLYAKPYSDDHPDNPEKKELS